MKIIDRGGEIMIIRNKLGYCRLQRSFLNQCKRLNCKIGKTEMKVVLFLIFGDKNIVIGESKAHYKVYIK